MAWAAWRPWWIGGLLAALLPVASWAPSTGWWLVDEFDLLVLATLAGAYARWGLGAVADRGSPGAQRLRASDARVWRWLLIALAVSALCSLAIGLRDAGVGLHTLSGSADLWLRAQYADYASAFNPLRVSKSLLWSLLLAPVMQHLSAQRQRDMAKATLAGLACGLALVCALVLWERWRYVGLLNFSDSYRTVASFWEMHVGGGAIDAYLAMAVPMAFVAVWLVPGGWRWSCAAVLALTGTYAVLTTYSRGVYLAVAVSLGLMALVAWRCKIRPASGGRRRGWALGLLALVLVAESAWVLGGHSYMVGRLARADADLLNRVEHWSNGLALLKTPVDVLTGLGAGRLPAQYSANVPGGEFPGEAQWQRGAAGAAHVDLSGPRTRQDVAYDFALTQRIDLAREGNYRVRIRYETQAPVVLLLSVCERHLLYDFRCQWQHVRPQAPVSDPRQWHDIGLPGKSFVTVGNAMAWREGMFGMTVLSPGQSVRIHEVELRDAQGRQILQNTDFARGLQHWFPAAQSQFLPWHMDNLYLEILIERGVIGLLVVAALAIWAWRCLVQALKRADPAALALTGSLASMGVLGMVISVTELPRIAFMLLLVLLTTSQLRPVWGHDSL